METTILKTVRGETMEAIFDSPELVNVKYYVATNLESEKDYDPKSNYRYEITIRHPDNKDANVLFEDARFRIENLTLTN